MKTDVVKLGAVLALCLTFVVAFVEPAEPVAVAQAVRIAIPTPTPSPSPSPTPVPTPTPLIVPTPVPTATPTVTPTPTVVPVPPRRQIGPPPPEWLSTIMRQHAEPSWGEGELAAWGELIYRESSYQPLAQNPRSTAFGLGQFLNPTSRCNASTAGTSQCYDTWASVGCVKTADASEQVRCMKLYLVSSYGTPSAALAHHDRNGSY